ncbi:MAG: hypothetical protein WAN86_18090 [Hyphomicrobiaceae bacterium]
MAAAGGSGTYGARKPLTFMIQIGVSTMRTRTDVSPVGAVASLDGVKVRIARTVRSIAAGASAWIETCADYYAASIIYERMAKLSDAELSRRGLSRATLASDIARACDRTTA